MQNFNVLEYSLHRLDVNEPAPINRIFDGSASDLNSYAFELIDDLLESPKSKAYQFKSMSELVPSTLLDILSESQWEENASKIAEKLLDVEKVAQDRIKHMQDIRQGCLLQMKIDHDGWTKFVLVKVDTGEYLDDGDLSFKTGLPKSKDRPQKAAIITFDPETNLVDELILSGSKQKITEYWYLSFLVAEELKSDELNTKNAFEAIDTLLQKDVKSVSSADYWLIRNDVISHFRNEDGMAFDELVEKVEKHKSVNPEFEEKKDGFMEKFKALPDNPKKPFDTQFGLKPEVVKARMRRRIMLDENVELIFKGAMEDMETRILADEDDKGQFLKIYTEKGYSEFVKLN